MDWWSDESKRFHKSQRAHNVQQRGYLLDEVVKIKHLERRSLQRWLKVREMDCLSAFFYLILSNINGHFGPDFLPAVHSFLWGNLDHAWSGKHGLLKPNAATLCREWKVETLTFDFSFLSLSTGDAVVTVRQHRSGLDTEWTYSEQASPRTVDSTGPGWSFYQQQLRRVRNSTTPETRESPALWETAVRQEGCFTKQELSVRGRHHFAGITQHLCRHWAGETSSDGC